MRGAENPRTAVVTFQTAVEKRSHLRSTMLCLSFILLFGREPPKEAWSYRSFASDFERVADSTSGLPMTERVKVFRSSFDKLYPGLYADADQSRLDGRIEKALTDFPSIRSTYDQLERKFPEALRSALKEFRGAFPGFTPPMPIYLIHSLGTRDGGTDRLPGAWLCCSERTKSPDSIGTNRFNRS